MSDTVRQYDWGGYIEVTVKDADDSVVDISSASSLYFSFVKPDKSVTSVTASLSSDGTDGKMRYVFADGDLDQVGKWWYQAVTVFGAGEFYSEPGTFYVRPILKRF